MGTHQCTEEDIKRLNKNIEEHEYVLMRTARALAIRWYDAFDSSTENIENAATELFTKHMLSRQQAFII